jgi:hypothetical protein
MSITPTIHPFIDINQKIPHFIDFYNFSNDFVLALIQFKPYYYQIVINIPFIEN